MADQGRSLTSIGGAAAGVVLGCAVLFGVVGMIRNGDTTPEIADGATPTEVATSADPSASAAPAGTPSPGEGAGEGSTTDATTAPSEAPTTAPTQAATEVPVAANSVAPGDVTIQVLDATGTGTRTAGNKVAARLREAGYNVVVVNSASKTYTDTTVFWSDGQSAAGRQIASAFGFPEAMPTPAEVSLSNSVNVHVVVGTDES